MLHGNRIFVFFAPSKTKCVDKHKPFEADEMPSSGHRLVQKRRKPPRNRELSTRQIVANLTSIDGTASEIRTHADQGLSLAPLPVGLWQHNSRGVKSRLNGRITPAARWVPPRRRVPRRRSPGRRRCRSRYRGPRRRTSHGRCSGPGRSSCDGNRKDRHRRTG